MNHRQRKFVEAYEGNATEAARAAGYAHPGQQGERLLKNVEIAQAIRDRVKVEQEAVVRDRQERQAFWSAVMADEDLPMKDRLKASELLGKSEGDFTTNIKQTVVEDVKSLSTEEINSRIAELCSKMGVAWPGRQ